MATLDDFVSFLQGASNSAASNLSAPVDGINWLLGKAGLPVSKAPVGGSDWLRQAGFTAEPKNRNAGLLGEFVGGVMPFVSAAKAPQIAAWLNQAGRNLSAPRTLNPQTGAIVWHGSPHKFNKFSMDKIGTGEGAQAYGHGLYLAESPEVAKSYQDLAKRVGPQVDGAPLNKMNASFAESALTNMYQNRLVAGLPPDIAATQTAKWGETHPQIGKDVADSFVQRLAPPPNGSLYKTDIPEEAVARFLDWDKPLSQQAPEVRALLKPALDEVAVRPNKNGPVNRARDAVTAGTGAGEQLYNQLRGLRGNDALAAQQLRELGIPGIRYLDGGSRSAGQGSSNFVVFSPDLIRILERNGQATGNIPWQPGEWRGLLGNN